MPSGRLSLETSFHLGWKWIKFTGLHPDLLLISVQQHRATAVARYLFTLFILLLSLAYGVFELIQLFIEIWSAEKMVDAVPNLIFANYIIIIIACQYIIWAHRGEISELFNDWKQVEMQSKSINLTAIRKVINGHFIWGLIFAIIILVLMFAQNYLEPQKSYFLSYYSFVRENFDILLICTFQSVSAGYVIIMAIIKNLYPLIFFYHAACIVENLVEEWEAKLRREEYIRVIWRKYERILHLVDRANKLFGSLLLMLHFYLTFNVCLMLYFSIVKYQSYTRILFTAILTTIVMTSMILTYNWVLSQLYFSTQRLQKSLADELSRKWYQLNEANRHLLVSFLARIDKGDMAVRPLNLFTVCPSNLLSILEATMNYVVVLAQSR